MVDWVSSVLTSDDGLVFSRYMFGKMPWEDPELYRAHSPLTMVRPAPLGGAGAVRESPTRRAGGPCGCRSALHLTTPRGAL